MGGKKSQSPLDLLAAHKAMKKPRHVPAYTRWVDKLSEADRGRLMGYLRAFAEHRDANYGWVDLHSLLAREWPDLEGDSMGYQALKRWCKQYHTDLFPELEGQSI